MFVTENGSAARHLGRDRCHALVIDDVTGLLVVPSDPKKKEASVALVLRYVETTGYNFRQFW